MNAPTSANDWLISRNSKILRRGDPELLEALVREPRRQIHELIRLRIPERAQDHGVDHGEDGRIRANSKGEGQDRDDGEGGRPNEVAGGGAKVLAEGIEGHVVIRRQAARKGLVGAEELVQTPS